MLMCVSVVVCVGVHGVCSDVWCVVLCVLRNACALKRPRLYVQNAPVCAFKTSACLKHAVFSEGAHGTVLNVQTGTRTPTPSHTTHHQVLSQRRLNVHLSFGLDPHHKDKDNRSLVPGPCWLSH